LITSNRGSVVEHPIMQRLS